MKCVKKILIQMMSANGPVLQFIQSNSRNNVNNIQVKNKPPQILPKPNNHVQNHASINSIKSQQTHHSTSIHSQQQGAFLINQVGLYLIYKYNSFMLSNLKLSLYILFFYLFYNLIQYAYLN